MERPPQPPGKRGYDLAFDLAYKLASEKLASFPDVGAQCLKAGAEYSSASGQPIIKLEYLGRLYQVVLPEVATSLVGSTENVPMRDKILILHYLTQAKGTPFRNESITYKELPDGGGYFPTFAKRAIKPLVERFAPEPAQLVIVGEKLGGRRADFGDAAVTFGVFPCVHITFVIWRGDEEFPADGGILFDRSVSDYLASEDLNIVCEGITWRLVRAPVA